MLRVNPDSRYTVDEVANDKWTNSGYSERPESHIPLRPDIVQAPNKKCIAELCSFGIKESDVLTVLKRPDLKHHPLTSLYHLCNETRARLEKEEQEEKKQKIIRDYQTLCDFRIDPSALGTDKVRPKLGASKLALAFKKWVKTSFKPLPPLRKLHHSHHVKSRNAYQSAQVLPSTRAYEYKTDLARKPVPHLLDLEQDSGLGQSQTGGSEFKALPIPIPPHHALHHHSTEKTVFQSLDKGPRLGPSHKNAGGLPWAHHKKSRSDGYQFISLSSTPS
jgi:hypothetical protein